MSRSFARRRIFLQITYRHKGRIVGLRRLYEYVSRTSRRKKKDPIIGSVRVEMLSDPEVRVVFVRDNNKNSGNWIALLSTDTDIKPEKICRIYARRWDIEVFKTIKQHLGLYGLEPRSYVSILAYTSIVFMRYMMLSYYQRQQIDDKTLPGMFREYAVSCKWLHWPAAFGCCNGNGPK